MKRLLFLYVLLLIVARAGAQETIEQTGPRFTKKSVVRDSSGKQYKTKELMKLMRTDYYKLTPAAPGTNADFIVRRMTESEVSSSRPNSSGNAVIRVGKPFPAFSVRDLDGASFSSDSLKGKVLVINFWFIGCGPCRKEIPELNQLTEKYAAHEIVFIAIALDKPQQLANFILKQPFNYRIVAEGGRESKRYGINGFPTNIVIDKDGIVRYYHTGYGRGTIAPVEKTIRKYLDKE